VVQLATETLPAAVPMILPASEPPPQYVRLSVLLVPFAL
jgi:hypothetical protein